MPVEVHKLWATVLSELQLQMTRQTFDTWLRGSRVVEAGEDRLIIYVRHAYAVDWLQNRLLAVVERSVARHAGRDMDVTFTARSRSLNDEVLGGEEPPSEAPGEPGD